MCHLPEVLSHRRVWVGAKGKMTESFGDFPKCSHVHWFVNLKRNIMAVGQELSLLWRIATLALKLLTLIFQDILQNKKLQMFLKRCISFHWKDSSDLQREEETKIVCSLVHCQNSGSG